MSFKTKLSRFVIDQKAIRYFGIIASFTVMFVATLAIIGWSTDNNLFKSWTGGPGGMNPMTSICLIVLSICTIQLIQKTSHYFTIVRIGSFTLLITMLLKYLYDFNLIDLNIEKLLFTEKIEDNKVAYATSISLILLSVWFISASTKKLRFDFLIPLITTFISFSSFHGHLFGDKVFYSFTMAFNSSFCILIISLSLLFFKRNPFNHLLVSGLIGGKVARLFFIGVIIIVPGLGFLVKKLIVDQYLPLENGISFLITGIVFTSAMFLLFAGTIFDRADNKRIELETQNASLAMLIKSVKIPVITLDSNFKITSWNTSAEELYGFHEKEVIGKGFSDFMDFNFITNTRPEIIDTLNEKNHYTGEIELISPKKRVYNILSSIAVIKNSETENPEYIALHKDISHIKAYEKKISDLNEELQASNDILQSQVYDLKSFAGTASHDLKSPLGNIIGLSDLIIEVYADNLDATAKEYLGLIKERALFMNLLIQDLLKFSSLGVKKIELTEIDLNEILNMIIKIIHSIPNKIHEKIEYQIKPLEKVQGDTLLVQQVLTNLISNSIKYTKPDQDIKISIEGIKSKDGYTVIVKDNGIGIKQEYLQQVFTPFKRFHSGYEGTGLGLAIVKKIMNKIEGSVRIESVENEGSIFYLKFKN